MSRSIVPLATVLFVFIFAGLVTLNGAMMLVSTPILLYLLWAWLTAPASVDVSVTREIAPLRSSPGTPVTVTVRLVNLGAALHEALIVDHLPAGVRVVEGAAGASVVLESGAETTLEYTVEGTRGAHEFSGVTVEYAGPLPVSTTTRRLDALAELVVLPDHRALSRVPIAPRRTLVFSGTNPARTGGEGTEFFDVREHQGTESLRRVNWRLSARFDERLFVNEFQQERVADVAVVLDCRAVAYAGTDAPADPSHRVFEAAATAAAGLTDALIDSGNRVGYLSYGLSLDWIGPGFGRMQKQRILTRIARARVLDSHAFSRLDAMPSRLFPAGSQVILVSPLTVADVHGLDRLAAYGYALLIASPDPTPFRMGQADGASAAAANRLLRLERSTLLARIRHSGVPVIDWNTTGAFEDAVTASMGAIRASWRRRRR